MNAKFQNNRPVILASVLSLLCGALLAGLTQQIVYAKNTIDRTEVKAELDKHDARDDEKFGELARVLAIVRTRQDHVLQELAENDAERREIKRRLNQLERHR